MAIAKGELDGNVLVGFVSFIAVKAQESREIVKASICIGGDIPTYVDVVLLVFVVLAVLVATCPVDADVCDRHRAPGHIKVSQITRRCRGIEEHVACGSVQGKAGLRALVVVGVHACKRCSRGGCRRLVKGRAVGKAHHIRAGHVDDQILGISLAALARVIHIRGGGGHRRGLAHIAAHGHNRLDGVEVGAVVIGVRRAVWIDGWIGAPSRAHAVIPELVASGICCSTCADEIEPLLAIHRYLERVGLLIKHIGVVPAAQCSAHL